MIKFKILRYIFFHFYNRLYQDGKLNTRNHPEWDAYGIVASGAIMWYLVAYEFYYYDLQNINFPENFKVIGFSVNILILILLYFIFLFKKRYEQIYFQYNHLNRMQRKKGLIISIAYLFLPIFIGAYIALKWHGKI